MDGRQGRKKCRSGKEVSRNGETMKSGPRKSSGPAIVTLSDPEEAESSGRPSRQWQEAHMIMIYDENGEQFS